MLIFHKIHFWKGTPQPSYGIPQPTHSRHLTGIFSAHSELKFFSNTAGQKKGIVREIYTTSAFLTNIVRVGDFSRDFPPLLLLLNK